MSNESIHLLVRADDIGSSHASNQACIDVYTKGICRSVELMAPCPWFPEAIRLLKEHPQYDVGVHLVLTSEWDNVKWRPLTHAGSFTDNDGFFLRTFRRGGLFENEVSFEDTAWDPGEVELELRAQIQLIRRHLPWTSHVGMHMAGLRENSTFSGIVERLTDEYGLRVDLAANGFQRLRGFGEGSQKLGPAEKKAVFLQNIEQLTEGRWVFVDHPAYETPEMQATYHPGYENVAQDREGVARAWTDRDVIDLIRRRNIKLISYADVKSGRL